MKLFNKLIILFVSAFLSGGAFATTNNQTSSNNSNQVIVYNNSDETIYPVAEVVRNKIAYHSYLSVTDPTKQRVDAGLQPGQSCVFHLPNANWNNGGRVYLFDQQPQTIKSEKLISSSAQPVSNTENTDNVPSCVPNVYQGQGMPLDAPSQLVEYTFANGNADYDISYVDHIYLPVAVEVSNGEVGYNGTSMNISNFQKLVNQFVTNNDWPHYLLPNNESNVKIPGAYNLYAQANARSDYNENEFMLAGPRDANNQPMALHNLYVKWENWLNNPTICQDESPANQASCHVFQQNVQTVWQAFKHNASYYSNQYNKPITDLDILGHVIGFVTFDKSIDPQWEYLTPDIETKAIALEYGYLSHPNDAKYDLNPYVKFVHNTLNMNVYGFSVDDAVGNVNEPGNSFTIAIGGLNGIKNTSKYHPFTYYKFILNYGGGWTNVNICDDNGNNCVNHQINPTLPPQPFPIPNNDSIISLSKVASSNTDNKPLSLKFVAHKITSSNGELANCEENGVAVKCDSAGVNLDYDEKTGVLNTDAPAPSNGPVANNFMLYWAPGWSTVQVCGQNPVSAAPARGVPIAPLNANNSCVITFTNGTHQLSFTVTKDASKIANCQGAECEAINLSQNGQTQNVSVPSPTSGPTPPVGNSALSIYTGASAVSIAGQTIAAHNHATVPVQDGSTKMTAGDMQCTVTITDDKITAGSDCTNDGFVVNGAKDGSGFVIDAP